METIVLKIGGSLITKKDSSKPEVDSANLVRICKEVGDAYKTIKSTKRLFIVHGAGSYGHIIAKKSGINEGISKDSQLVDFAETQRLQNELNIIVTKELIKNGVPAFPFQCSSHATMKGKKLIKMDSDTAAKLVSIGIVPVAFGVPAYDESQKCSILSGDAIAPFYAQKLGAKLIIHATDVDGVFDSDPKNNKSAKLIKVIKSSDFDKIKKGLSGSANTDITGGMLNKISELLVLSKTGIKSVIINGSKPGLVKNALTGKETIGTIVA